MYIQEIFMKNLNKENYKKVILDFVSIDCGRYFIHADLYCQKKR